MKTLFKTKTVDSIVASFNKIVTDLDDLIKSKSIIIDTNNRIITSLTSDNSTHQAEIERAAIIQKNVNKLLSI